MFSIEGKCCFLDNINFRQLIEELNKQFHDCNVNPPTNTIAHIFRKESQENFISDWIAYLIDPVSFGNAEPLSALLEVAGFDDCIDKNEIIEISREKTFDDQRRIDFYIETEELIIGIENKIWSGLGYHQLKDYSKSLEKLSNGKEIRKILLLPQNNTSINLSKNNSDISVSGFVSVTYEDFVNALRKLQINFIENLRSSFLLQDFITYVEEYFMNSNVDKKKNFDMASFLFEHKKLIKELESCRNNLQTQFVESVEKKLAETFDEEIWEINFPRTGSYFQLFKKQSGWGAPVHFELYPTDGFPCKSILVVLHTREGKNARNNKTERLYNLQVEVEDFVQKKYGQKEFELDYENGLESYNKSLDKVFSVLKDIVEEFTDTIDNEISLYASESKKISSHK